MKLRWLASLLLLTLLLAGTASALRVQGAVPAAAATTSPTATVAATAAPLKLGAATAVPTTQAAAAAAQSSVTPFININLEAGIPLDPFFVSLRAGGPIDASTLVQGCSGHIPNNPSVSFNFNGQADSLKFFFYSDGDPVLVVQNPDGSYQCDDNTNRLLLDPELAITEPQAGRYNVWVGSSRPKQLIAGALVLTARPGVNVGNFSLRDMVKRPAIPETLPSVQVDPAKRAQLELSMSRARTRVPTLQANGPAVTVPITATGSLQAHTYMNEDLACSGFVRLVPNYAFTLTGQTEALHVFFEGNHDATLIVKTPEGPGSFTCADDAGPGNFNPQIDIANPKNGLYAVWVGRVNATEPVTGTLTITGSPDLKPKPLKIR